MKGILKKVELKEFKTEDGRKFKKVIFVCDCIDDKNEVRTLKGSYSEDFAKKYFAYCNVKTKDLIGKTVGVVCAKKTFESEDGETRIYNYIKFLNVLDEEGKEIIMPKDGEDNSDLNF